MSQIFQNLHNFQCISTLRERAGKEIKSGSRRINIEAEFDKFSKEILKIVEIFNSMEQNHLEENNNLLFFYIYSILMLTLSSAITN